MGLNYVTFVQEFQTVIDLQNIHLLLLSNQLLANFQVLA